MNEKYKDLKVVLNSSDVYGCGFMRVKQPAEFLQQHMNNVNYNMGFPPTDPRLEEADIIGLQRANNEFFKEWLPQIRGRGKKIVSDIDDLLWGIPAGNLAHNHYGRKELDKLDFVFKNSDEITTSTIPLAEYLKKRFGKEPIVIPNMYHTPEDFVKPENEKIRIGWHGSYTHKCDFDHHLWKAITALIKKYDIEFHTFGYCPPQYQDFAIHTEWSTIDDFMSTLIGLNLDIGIIVAANNDFNKCKCLVGNTKLVTNEGICTIEDIVKNNRMIKVWQERDYKDISSYFKYENQKTLKITTKSGFEIEGTLQHKLRINDKFVRMDSLSVGDKLDISYFDFPEVDYQTITAPLFLTKKLDSIDYSLLDEDMLPTLKINERWGRFLGYVLGDGCVTGSSVIVSGDTEYPDVIDDLKTFANEIGITTTCFRKKDKDTRASARGVAVSFNSRNLLYILQKKLNLIKNGKKVFEVPDIILKSPKSVIKEFLSGLFEADGSVSKINPSCDLSSKSKEFMQQIQFLLLGFGIKSNIRNVLVKTAFEKTINKEYYRLCLNREACDIFYKEIGFMSKIKQEKLRILTERKHSNAFKEYDMKDEIVCIEETFNDVYDIEVPDNHYYMANGIISHNSNLKYIEYSLAKVASVAHNVYPYASTIEDGEDGFLVKNPKKDWYAYLEELILNKITRENMIEKANKKVKQQFTFEGNGDLIVGKYEELFNRLGF